VTARYGIVGIPIPVQATPEWMERLRDFTCRIYDQSGAMLAEGPGGSLLGHPLNVVLWILDSLKAEGIPLRKRNLLFLGTITKLTPTAPGINIRAQYVGLDPKGPLEITVTVE